MIFLVVFNIVDGVFSYWSEERFSREKPRRMAVISCHDTQEGAIEKAERHNRILKEK